MMMLSEDQFIESMSNDFPHLKVTKNDLLKPSKQFVMQFYSSMLEQIMRLPVGSVCNFTAKQRDLVKSCHEPRSIADHVRWHNLYIAVKYMFEVMAVMGEFHYSDLLLPWLTPKRTFVFMTNMYQCFSVCAIFDEQFEALSDVDAKVAKLKELQEEHASLKEQIQINEEKKLLYAERIKDIKRQLTELATRNDENQLAIKSLQVEEQAEMEKFNNLEIQEVKMQEAFSKIDNERKYYESLIVSDDGQVIENHRKLQKKKEQCFMRLRQLEQQAHDGSSKLSQFDTVLGLYDELNQVLRGEITIANKSFDLKEMNSAALSLKKEGQALEQEALDLELQLREKDESLPCSQNELARLDAEKDSITCTWKEKQGRYRQLLNELQISLSELTHRAEIEEAGLKDTARKFAHLSEMIAEKEREIKQMDEECKENFAAFETEMIKMLRQINSEALSYKKRMQN